MEFSTEALGQIVTDIWTSMLGFPVEARGEPIGVNGTRHLSASVQISGGWEGTVLVELPTRGAPPSAWRACDVQTPRRPRTTRSATPSARWRT